MALFIVLALLLIPIAEIAVFIQVGDLIGLWPTLLGIVLTAVLGAALVRRQGFATLARSRASMDRNELPVAELFDGLCILLAGVLLLTPGFLTDTLGLLLLIPPLRTVLRQVLWAKLLQRGTFVHVNRTGAWPRGAGQYRPGQHRSGDAPPDSGRPAGRGQVIEGEFSEVTDDDEDERPEGDVPVRNHPWSRRG